jgi:hypothetical protein
MKTLCGPAKGDRSNLRSPTTTCPQSKETALLVVRKRRPMAVRVLLRGNTIVSSVAEEITV